jgi:F-box protein 11
MLPARKRPRRTYSNSTEQPLPHPQQSQYQQQQQQLLQQQQQQQQSQQTSAAHYLQYEMPDEVLLTIFSYLLEQDLCRLSLVCKRFQTIANDTELWKSLYQNVYEYDIPLFNMEPCKFQFIKPEDSDYVNPWKESFRQLYRGIHVRLGYQDRVYKGRTIAYFNTVQAALDCADERNSAGNASGQANSSNNSSSNLLSCSAVMVGGGGAATPAGLNISNNTGGPNSPSHNGADCDIVTEQYPGCLIFLHAGTYRGEFLVIDSDVALIGAAPGNVAESIVLERESESTVMFVEGAKHAYVGHMTLKFSPELTSTVPHHKHYCLEVGENCSPTIDHCIIRSTSVGEC